MIQIKAHDDVVENVDFEKLACSDEVTGDFDVGLGWCRFAARMIVLCEAPIYVLCDSKALKNKPLHGAGQAPQFT